MKKILAYLTVCVAIIAAGCTDFGDENQLTLPAAPSAEISGVTPGSETVTFNVKPSGAAGYYSWLIVESESVDSTLLASSILKQTAEGVAMGIVNYAAKTDSTFVVSDLDPFTVYQIYAVASSTDGVVSEIKNVSFRTLDDGGKPTPTSVALEDTTVTITFHEPLRKGTGKVYVSYFAKNTLSGSKPLVVASGFESYNPQNIVVNDNNVTVSGKSLIVKLPSAPAGAYASITYDAGTVLDLEGNGSNAFTQKADTLISGVPSRGITVHIANKTWKLHNEFEEINPDTLVAFSDWEELVISPVPDEGTKVSKKIADAVSTVVYKESGKFTTLDVTTWGLLAGNPAFMLPEEPNYGSTVDLNISAGAFEDVYGNKNEALAIEGNYIYSYGYTMDDLLGTWRINGISATNGNAIAPDTVIIADDPDSDDDNDVLIMNMAKKLLKVNTSPIKAVFNPDLGTLTVPDWQTLTEAWTHPTAGTADVLFSTYDTDEIVFAVTSSGKITSSQAIWGYYLDGIGALRWYAPTSTWTRISTDVPAPTPAPFRVSEVRAEVIPIIKSMDRLKK